MILEFIYIGFLEQEGAVAVEVAILMLLYMQLHQHMQLMVFH